MCSKTASGLPYIFYKLSISFYWHFWGIFVPVSIMTSGNSEAVCNKQMAITDDKYCLSAALWAIYRNFRYNAVQLLEAWPPAGLLTGRRAAKTAWVFIYIMGTCGKWKMKKSCFAQITLISIHRWSTVCCNFCIFV